MRLNGLALLLLPALAWSIGASVIERSYGGVEIEHNTRDAEAIGERDDDLSPRDGILAKRDAKCWILGSQSQGCDSSPTSGKRVGTLVHGTGKAGSPSFGVSCWKPGTYVDANRFWYYVPAYKCYVWSGWVNYDCAGKFRLVVLLSVVSARLLSSG